MRNFFTLFLSICSLSLIGQTIYHTESFEDGLPPSWSVDGEWRFGAASEYSSPYFTIPENNTGNMAIFNDDLLGGGHRASGSIFTSAYDLTEIEGTIYLELQSYFPNLDFSGFNERAIISISLDGETYEFLKEIAGGDMLEFSKFALDISEYAGSIIYLQFTYEDGGQWNFGWAFDEVSITDGPFIAPARDYLISAGSSSLISEAQAGIEYIHEGFIKNAGGTDTIRSFDVLLVTGEDTLMQSYSNVSIPMGGLYKYSFDQGLEVEGNKEYRVSISNVNNDPSSDANELDNVMTFRLEAIALMESNKKTVAELATSTSCAQCPAGNAYLHEMTKRFPDHFIGVAVHTNDPMENIGYFKQFGAFTGINEYPQLLVDRSDLIDAEDLIDEILKSSIETPLAGLSVGASVSTIGITTSIEVEFMEDVTEAYNVAIILTEDAIIGTDEANYFQTNAWSTGMNGTLAGYEFLPDTIPAAYNQFNQVGRALIGGWSGNSVALDADTYATGATEAWVFDEIILDKEVRIENLNLIGVLINRETGHIEAATQVNIAEATANGLFESVSTNRIQDPNFAEVYPNPVHNNLNIELDLAKPSDLNVSIYNSIGQLALESKYSHQVGKVKLQENMSHLPEGMYVVCIKSDDKYISKKVNVLGQ